MLGTALCSVFLLSAAPARTLAETICAFAKLDHPLLIPTDPINYSVEFGTTFSTISSVLLDATWAGNGLDPGEAIRYTGLAGGPFGAEFGYINVGSSTQFSRSLSFRSDEHTAVTNFFRRGAVSGQIIGAPEGPRGVPGGPPGVNTTALFASLKFTVDGTPGPIPGPAIFWLWSFDETEIVVGPSDSIILRATLFNTSLSTESITQVGGASFTGDLQKVWDFRFGPTGSSSDYPLQFAGLHVAPGESFSFILGILTPIGGSAPLGVHPFCCEAHLDFGSDTLSSEAPLNTFQIRVVPEPPLLGLFGLGILLLLGYRMSQSYQNRS